MSRRTLLTKFLFLIFLQCLNPIYSAEASETETALESISLKNITQLTFPSMGFEKAGEAYFSPDGKTIAFQAVPQGEEQYQIYLMHLAEGIPRMISTGKGACTCAYFHPNGKKIIFASSHEDPQYENTQQEIPGYQRQGGNYAWQFTPYMNIYEADLDGSNLTALTTGPAYSAECAYSSDGTQIVFASNRDGNMNIYKMKADGTDIANVTASSHGYNGGPFFSPDDQQIVFRADYDKADYLQIYVINVNGKELQQVIQNDAVNWAPYWHPNGKVIAYTTSLHGHWRYEIYLQNIYTAISHRLTYNPTFDGLPVFNREGTKLMWTSKRGPDNTSQVFIADFILPPELN